MKVPNGLRHPDFMRAFGRICQVAPWQAWPESILQLFQGDATLTNAERLCLCSFLYGNGATKDDVLAMVQHRLRDAAAKQHVQYLLKMFSSHPSQFHYYDVNQRDRLNMLGAPHGVVYAHCLRRRMRNSLDAYAWHNKITLMQQEEFLKQDDILDARTFFALVR